eukprot:768801-Hanusia_phi.AAC.5
MLVGSRNAALCMFEMRVCLVVQVDVTLSVLTCRTSSGLSACLLRTSLLFGPRPCNLGIRNERRSREDPLEQRMSRIRLVKSQGEE